MKPFSIPIVFMGGPENERMQDYYFECKRIAGDNCIFLGHVEHRSREFYSTMKHARVACLASNCETPGIALLEAGTLGARPIVTIEGGTPEYYGFSAEYLNPRSANSITQAVKNAWARGRMKPDESNALANMTWNKTAELTIAAYRMLPHKHDQ